MSDAVLSVTFAGPLVTVQDMGRSRNLRFGVPASGPMDTLAYAAAQAALGNEANAPCIEVSLGGLILRCLDGPITVSVAGGDFNVEHNGQTSGPWAVLTLQKGDTLAVRAGSAGSWAYLAFAGSLSATRWLGSHATHGGSGFGGGAIQTSSKLYVQNAATRDDRVGKIERPDLNQGDTLDVVLGPQDQHFEDGTTQKLLSENFHVSDAYDRMGMRLSGPTLKLGAALSIPSEPLVRGSIQVSGDGVPTVLLADHQTTGGYPKLATVISPDLPKLAQRRAGDLLRFNAISAEDAIKRARTYATTRNAYLADISNPRGSLEERLMRENLNHGWQMN